MIGLCLDFFFFLDFFFTQFDFEATTQGLLPALRSGITLATPGPYRMLGDPDLLHARKVSSLLYHQSSPNACTFGGGVGVTLGSAQG